VPLPVIVPPVDVDDELALLAVVVFVVFVVFVVVVSELVSLALPTESSPQAPRARAERRTSGAEVCLTMSLTSPENVTTSTPLCVAGASRPQ
jgi:hypothetical protein